MAQLFSRVGMRITVARPTKKDIEAMLDASEISDAKQRLTLQTIAGKPGALRGMAKTLRIARMLALGADQPLSEEHIHERLAGVVIECLAFSKLISTYDRPATLFYLDPPYWDCETDYGEGVFGKADFTAMAKQLGAISGKFILSLNDVPEVRHIFRRFNIEAVETGYSLNGKSQSRVGEVLISNL